MNDLRLKLTSWSSLALENMLTGFLVVTACCSGSLQCCSLTFLNHFPMVHASILRLRKYLINSACDLTCSVPKAKDSLPQKKSFLTLAPAFHPCIMVDGWSTVLFHYTFDHSCQHKLLFMLSSFCNNMWAKSRQGGGGGGKRSWLATIMGR